MITLLKKIVYFFRNIKGSIRIRENKSKVTLVGEGQFFDNASGINLYNGSTKNDIIIEEHAELFGELVSHNHGKIHLGKWVKIGYNSFVNCVNSVTIDDDTAIADNVMIVDHNFHPINPADRLYMRHTPHGSLERSPIFAQNAPVVIGKNVWIGTNVRINKGVIIGDNSVIGANSVVTKSIPANCVAVGIPAKVVKEDIDKTTTSVFPIKH